MPDEFTPEVCLTLAVQMTAAERIVQPNRVVEIVWSVAESLQGELEIQNEHEAQTALLRDIFGNPFRPVTFDPARRTPTTLSLTQAAYDERALPSGELDPARLTILADALGESGCTNEDILTHLRGSGPHVRGCWALDLILGKE